MVYCKHGVMHCKIVDKGPWIPIKIKKKKKMYELQAKLN